MNMESQIPSEPFRLRATINLCVRPLVGLAALALLGCANVKPPPEPHIEEISPSEVAVDSYAVPAVEGIQPVHFKLTNVSALNPQTRYSDFVAVQPNGERVAPLSLDQAIARVGDEKALRSAMTAEGTGTALSRHFVHGLKIGSLTTIRIGCTPSRNGNNQLLAYSCPSSLALALPVGIIAGTISAASNGISSGARFRELLLHPGGSIRDTAEGFVLFPSGQYKAIDIWMVDSAAREVGREEIPWPAEADSDHITSPATNLLGEHEYRGGK